MVLIEQVLRRDEEGANMFSTQKVEKCHISFFELSHEKKEMLSQDAVNSPNEMMGERLC